MHCAPLGFHRRVSRRVRAERLCEAYGRGKSRRRASRRACDGQGAGSDEHLTSAHQQHDSFSLWTRPPSADDERGCRIAMRCSVLDIGFVQNFCQAAKSAELPACGLASSAITRVTAVSCGAIVRMSFCCFHSVVLAGTCAAAIGLPTLSGTSAATAISLGRHSSLRTAQSCRWAFEIRP
jgi:hypothetical protein